jgi:tetratricopeptide (TPR) repeat protein
MRAAVVSLLLAWAAVAQAQPNRELARQHWAAGDAKFKAGDFRGAMIELAAADALAPSPILSYDIAVCHEQLGENEEAVRRYQEYLGRRPDAPNRRLVESRIAALSQLGPPAALIPPPNPPATDDGLAVPRSVAEPAEAPAEPLPPASQEGGRRYDDAFARMVPDQRGQAEQAPPPGPPPQPGQPPPPPLAPPPEPHKETPLYKQWWFWAVVGVGAIVVISAVSSSDKKSTNSTASGVTLFTF